jgi:hypothetical protein
MIRAVVLKVELLVVGSALSNKQLIEKSISESSIQLKFISNFCKELTT